jgi:hypothetical protein
MSGSASILVAGFYLGCEEAEQAIGREVIANVR